MYTVSQKTDEMEMNALRIILAFCHLSAKYYQNWCKFDEVLTKINLHSFLRHGVLYRDCWRVYILYLWWVYKHIGRICRVCVSIGNAVGTVDVARAAWKSREI